MTTSPHDYSDLELSVGDRLRRARERRTGLDQAEFADLINVSRGTVSNYERDRIPNGPRRRLVFNSWASACEVSVEWLEHGIDPRTGGDDGGGTIAPSTASSSLSSGPPTSSYPALSAVA